MREDCRVSVFLDSHASALLIITQENYDSRGFDEWTWWIFLILTLNNKEGGTYLDPCLQCSKLYGGTLERCSILDLSVCVAGSAPQPGKE